MIPAISEYTKVNGVRQSGLWLDQQGTNKATLHQVTASFSEMGERSITAQVRIDGDVVPNFDGWELSFKGERFILNTKDPQAAKDNTTRNSLVDLTFVSWPINELKRYFFFEAASVGAGTAIADKYKASVNLNVEDFAVLFNQVLNHYFGGKIVFSLYMSGQGQYSTDRALVEINYTYIWDVLVKFFDVYGVRWRIEYNSTTDVYTIKAGWPDASIDDHDFEYGYKGGLLRFERQVQDVDIHNILLGRGGEKNLPYRYFKRVDPQNPDWAADPDAIPELANISFDRLRDINFRWYVRGWMQNPNHDTSWEEGGYVYPTYSSVPAQYQFAYDKGRTDERFNPVEYVRDLPSIEAYGEHWGALDDNDEVFPTIQGVTREPYGRIDETVAVSEIITDDISAMAQNAAVEKSINRMSVSLYGNTRTEFELLSEEFTIPEGSTGNISYAPFGTDDIYPNLVRFDTENSTLVAVSGDTEYPISAIPAGTYRLKLNMVIARSGQATSATGTYGIENIVLSTSSQDADAWKPTFDIWVKNIWNTAPQQGESDAQYAERVWLPILGDRAGNEAKIVFSSGFMSISEDYEFTIAAYPVRDTSKSINGVPSEWRITLRKSDAEFDTTGLYIPNASTGGKPVAGDKFFFIGIDMPHMYVTLAEEDLNTNKSAQLDTEAAVNPTWIMNLDKVRVHTLEDDEYGQTLADRLAAGTKVWITDPRFTPGRKLQLYIQSITYTWNEPTDESPYIVPDIEVVLSDKVVATESVVQRIQNDVSAIKQQYARISDVEAVVRSVAEPIFLKKTGESDSSDSPTQFSSKVTSKGFRQGGIGGKGWGIYRDNTSDFAEGEEGEGDTVIEVDRIVARKELQVNSLVVNQIAYRGGMEVISAAKIEVSKVIETDTEYICYFDQRRNSVANSFVVGDIAMGMIFNAANTAVERYYKAIVTATDIDCIHLSKTQKVGAGAPAVGDTIIQYGNPTNTARQYVIVRDVIGGGYERMISGLNSLNTDGDEYYFAGKQSSESGPRWFVGSHAENGDYAEYINGVLTIKADVIFKAGQVIPGIADLTDDVEALEYLKTALPKSDTIITGGLILSKVIALRDANNAVMSGINGDPTLSNIAAWYGGPMADKDATPTPQDYAKSIFRFDGSGYLAGGNIHWDDQGYGGIPGITWSNDGTNDIVTIGANVRLASVDGDTVTDLLNAVNSIKDWFEIVDGNIHVKKNRGFWTGGFISAGGLSSGGGAAAGNATLVAQTYGGTLSATGIEPINFYSKERVDQLLLTAGTVQTVAGIAPTSGDIPVASLKSALGLGAAAAYGIGSVASGNTGLVTGGSVYSAINEAVSSVMKMQGTTTTPISDGSTTNPVVIDGSSYTAKKGDVVLYDGKEYLWAGSAWEQLGDEASWALKTTSISAGTGLEGGGTLASNRTISLSAASIASLALADSAYQKPSTGIPKTDLASGVQTSLGKADSAYQKPSTGIPQTDLATELSTKVNHGESAYTNLNDWFEIIDGNIHVKGNRGFYSDSFISAGGLSSGGGSGGIDPEAMWQLLGDSTNEQIAASHLTTALNGYLPLAGGTMSNTNVVTNLNADLLDGYHASTSNTPWGTIPVINANGWMDIGKHLEFHFDNSPGIDYSTVLQCTGNWTNVVALPSASGTLALTSDLSAYVAKGGDTMTGSLTIDDPDAYFIRNFKYYYTTPGWARNIVTFTVDGVSKFVIGAYSPSYTAGGSGNGIEYAYIGVNDYNGTNLRFGSDSTLTWGTYSIYHQGNLSLSTLAGSTQIGSSTQPVYYNGSALVATNLSTTYAPYNAAGYLPLNGGTMTGTIMVGVYTAFGVSDGTFYLGSPEYPVNLRSNGTTQINGNTIYHAGNLTKSVLTELLDANGGYYLSLSGGTMSNTNLVTNLNADLLDGYHASYGSNKPYGTIPVITDGGFMDVGKHFEFHYDNTTGSDYSTVLQCTGNYGNIVSLPSGTGTLALTTDNVASATQLQTSRSLWGNSFNGTADINGSITITAYGGVNIFSGYLNLRHSPSQDSLYAGLKYDVNGTEALILSTGYSNAAILFCPGVGLGTATKDSSYVMKLVPSEIIVAAPIALYREINAYAQYGSAYGLRYCSISTWGSWARSILQIYTDNTIMHVGAYGDAGTQINYAFFGGSYDSGYAIRVYPSSYPTVGSNTIWHEGNSNLSTVPWACSTLTANGNITATGAITAGSASDARLKTNIQSLSAEAAKRIVMALNPVTFTWNSTATELYDQYKGNDLGFIAQEVEPYLPQAVGTIFEKYMRLDYTKFITPLISVAQDHETRIRQLERENAELKRRLNMN